MGKVLIRLLQVLTVIILMPLLLSYLSVYVSPTTSWPLAFFGLFYPIWLLLAALALLFWLLVKPRWALVPLVVILAGYTHVTHFLGINLLADNQIDSGVKVLTWNIQNFNLYNWTQNDQSRADIFQFLEEQQPDILCLQEFYTRRVGRHENVEALQQRLGLPYSYFHNRVSARDLQEFGLATFSRYPIVGKGHITFDNSYNLCVYTDLLIEGDTFRIFNVHLQSIALGKQGEAYVERIIEEQDTDMEQSRVLLGKLKTGFLARAPQAQQIAAAIRESSHPVVVCGDFNDTPVSYAYREISSGLSDAFAAKGKGVSPTFAGKIPGLRIDHILYDPALEVLGYRRLRPGLSDHHPVMASFRFPGSDSFP